MMVVVVIMGILVYLGSVFFTQRFKEKDSSLKIAYINELAQSIDKVLDSPVLCTKAFNPNPANRNRNLLLNNITAATPRITNSITGNTLRVYFPPGDSFIEDGLTINNGSWNIALNFQQLMPRVSGNLRDVNGNPLTNPNICPEPDRSNNLVTNLELDVLTSQNQCHTFLIELRLLATKNNVTANARNRLGSDIKNYSFKFFVVLDNFNSTTGALGNHRIISCYKSPPSNI